MTTYNDIQTMWGMATHKIVAPKGFKDKCEEYILGTMTNVFKTDKFIIPDDLYCTGITSIEITPTMYGKGNFYLTFNREGKEMYRHDLDDTTIYNITRTIYEFESKYNFDFVKISEQDGVAVPFRTIGGFQIEPIVKEGEVQEYVDSDGAYHCNMASFYENSDSDMLKLISYNFNNVRDLFSRYFESRNAFIAKKPYVDENALRNIAYHYIFRAVENGNRHEITRPCGDLLFEVNIVPENDETGFEEARLDFIRLYSQDELIFGYSNGREEFLEEIDMHNLWEIVYAIEYKKHPHYEEIAKNAEKINVVSPARFSIQVKAYLRHTLINVFQSSRFGHFCGQRLMLMDKSNTPLGYLYDVICKNNEITIEYLADDDTNINFMCEDNSKKVYLENFDELSPISMFHIARYVGYIACDDTNEIPNYFFVNHTDIDGVRVPYREIEGKLVTTATAINDSEMKEVAKNATIEYCMDDVFFYNFHEGTLETALKWNER